MALPTGRGFGWSLALRGGSRDEIERSIAGLRRQAEAIVDGYFPAAEGFAVEAEAGAAALTLRVRRGDFQGYVEVFGAGPLGQHGDGHVRVSGRGGSRSLEVTERICLRITDGVRWGATAAGAGFMGLVLAGLFVTPPRFAVETLFFLGGLLLVVIGGLTMAVSVGIGAWVSEQVCGWIGGRALARAGSDAALRHDLQRWRALCRVLVAQRELLSGALRRQPFRHDRTLWQADPPGA